MPARVHPWRVRKPCAPSPSDPQVGFPEIADHAPVRSPPETCPGARAKRPPKSRNFERQGDERSHRGHEHSQQPVPVKPFAEPAPPASGRLALRASHRVPWRGRQKQARCFRPAIPAPPSAPRTRHAAGSCTLAAAAPRSTAHPVRPEAARQRIGHAQQKHAPGAESHQDDGDLMKQGLI